MRNSKRRKLKRKAWLRKKSLYGNKKQNKSKRQNKKSISGRMLRIGGLSRFLENNNFHKNISNVTGNGITFTIPDIFSFSENTNETIGFLKAIFFFGTKGTMRELSFDHSKCKVLGICASTVMDVILLEIKKIKRSLKHSFEISGELPQDTQIKSILKVSGIMKHLGFPEPQNTGVEKLELIICGSSSKVSTDVTDYFIRCLSKQNLSLKKEGSNLIAQMVGEIIDNCAIHGGDFCRWYTLGHYSQDNDYGECLLVIFNFGQTIYESLKRPDTTENIKNSLREMTKKHMPFMGVFSNWAEEPLWTLYALQDGVSRLRNIEAPDRGTGTVNFIEAIQSIGGNRDGKNAIMSITSGKTQIYFDGTYRLQESYINNEARKIIAFNTDNDLHRPPDSKYVKFLKHHFPGTVISIKFYIDREYILKN